MLVFRLDKDDIEVGRASEQNAQDIQPLGRIQRQTDGGYRLTETLDESSDPQEKRVLQDWLEKLTQLERDREGLLMSVVALTLPQKLAQAEQWLAQTEHDQAGFIALRIAAAMHQLETLLDAAIPPTPERSATDTARESDIRGRLDQVAPQRITGWALQPSAERPLQIRLRINDHRELSVTADQHRPDLLKLGRHPTGNCGFLVQLGPQEALKAGDQVRAFVEPSGFELNNSPAQCA